MNDINLPGDYEELSQKEKLELSLWIYTHFEPSKRAYTKSSSYGLKHDFERDTRIYVTNGQFKGAMLARGYKVKDEKALNWYFKMKKIDYAKKLTKGKQRLLKFLGKPFIPFYLDCEPCVYLDMGDYEIEIAGGETVASPFDIYVRDTVEGIKIVEEHLNVENNLPAIKILLDDIRLRYSKRI